MIHDATVELLSKLSLYEQRLLTTFEEKREKHQAAMLQESKETENIVVTFLIETQKSLHELRQKSNALFEKLGTVLQQEDGYFSASEVVVAQGDMSRYTALAKGIRRSIKSLAHVAKEEATALKKDYITIISELYENVFKTSHAHLQKEMQKLNKARAEQITQSNSAETVALNIARQSIDYKATIADQMLDLLHKLRLNLSLEPPTKHHEHHHHCHHTVVGGIEDLKRSVHSFVDTFVQDGNPLLSKGEIEELFRREKAIRHHIRRTTVAESYELQKAYREIVTCFADRITCIAIEQIQKGENMLRDLFKLVSLEKQGVSGVHLLAFAEVSTKLVEQSKKMVQAITISSLIKDKHSF